MFHLFTVTKFFPWHAVLCHGIKHYFLIFFKARRCRVINTSGKIGDT